MYVAPDLQLPELGILLLLAEGNDVARVAASFNLSCATTRGLAVNGAREALVRYNAVADPTGSSELPLTYAPLLQLVKSIIRSDVSNAVAILTPRERLEIFEVFAYFRAFCNSPVQNLEVNHGKV